MTKFVLKIFWLILAFNFGLATFGIFGRIELNILIPDWLVFGIFFMISLFELIIIGRPNPKTTDFTNILKFDIGMDIGKNK